MALLYTITEGWTKPLGPFTLSINGAALNLTGFTVNLKLRPLVSSTFSDTAGDVTVLPDQFGTQKGQVMFKPDVEDFKASKGEYAVHWELTDANGDVAFWPNGDPDTIKVVKP